MSAEISVVGFANPLAPPTYTGTVCLGKSLAEIIFEMELPLEIIAAIEITVTEGGGTVSVSRQDSFRMFPGEGAFVEVKPRVQGPAVGPLLQVLVSAAAPSIATNVLGLVAGTFGAHFATAAISVVGGLLISAIIPPPSLARQGTEKNNFTITGIQNAFEPYGVIPVLYGRHMLFPKRAARGFREMIGDDVYYHSLLNISVGEVAIDQIRIGTTPLTEFSDWSIEFRNVDEAMTKAQIPDLINTTDDPVKGTRRIYWRGANEKMRLYPDDIAEEGYSDRLVYNVPIVRRSRTNTVEVGVDVSFNGLGWTDNKGRKVRVEVEFKFEYQEVGGSSWTDVGNETYGASDSRYHNYTKKIEFPTSGQYDIRITRLTIKNDDNGFLEDGDLTAIRSISEGTLPVDPEVSQIAIRIKATEQLNGQIDNLNLIANRLLPIWDGSGWTSPQKTRHPAWTIAAIGQSSTAELPLSNDEIDLAELKAWADEEAHWTFDTVIDQDITNQALYDRACAAGRARRGYSATKHTIIRDNAAAPVSALFNDRNMTSFSRSKIIRKQIHGFKVSFISEAKDYQEDEVPVYADGYSAANATILEPLKLEGIVLQDPDLNLGNVFRHARYHLAVSQLRPDIYTFGATLAHFGAADGSKVRVVTDVVQWGLASGRITAITEASGNLQTITLDEAINISPVGGASELSRLRIIKDDGSFVEVETTDAGGFNSEFSVTNTVPAAGVSKGANVQVELRTVEPVDLIITNKRQDSDFNAEMTAVAAAPGVLVADTEAIPAYNPVRTIAPRPIYGPEPANILSVQTGAAYLIFERDGSVTPRIAANINNTVEGNEGVFVALAVREKVPDARWVQSEYRPRSTNQVLSGPVEEGVIYETRLMTVDKDGRSRGAVRGPDIEAVGLGGPPPRVEDFAPSVTETGIVWNWTASGVPDVRAYEIRYSTVPSASWAESSFVDTVVHPNTSFVTPLRAGRYFIRAVDFSGKYSEQSGIVDIDQALLKPLNVVATIDLHPNFTGLKTGVEVIGNNLRLFKKPDDTFVATGNLESDQVVDLGQVFNTNLAAEFQVSVDDGSVFMDDWASLADIVSLAAPEATNASVTALFRSTTDDPSGTPIWSDWMPITSSAVVGRGFQFGISLSSLEPSQSPLISLATFTLDMPDRVESQHNVSVPSGGLDIAYSAAFHETPAFVTTPRPNLPSDVLEVTNETASGCRVEFKTAAGGNTSGVIDWHVRGFGRVV